MHTNAIFAGVVLTAIVFLQGTSAPPALMGIATVAGTKVAGIIRGGLKAGGKGRRADVAFLHARRMAMEIEAEISRRKEEDGSGSAPAGASQYAWDACFDQVKVSNTPINVNGPINENHIRVTGLPPACMNMATALGSLEGQRAVPVPCGSDCIDYGDMSPGYYEAVRSFVNERLTGNRTAVEKRDFTHA
ncbi:hypothetical protein GCG54_00012616 [Colletotrichum gloeosporioides]|uniref:Uncharacterized protein n=1 Tax=Colletotrichum gloeosporioides TaxID=474922 RepID=A0A8H4FMX7_COLGL|nr:uncharacterized protein GCG54_00012616 [Colletotrichum gloeosporioides]KAF3808037.1 hypothetical protein GCG54_00012616 [Colletotrichum gloeosporioides]